MLALIVVNLRCLPKRCNTMRPVEPNKPHQASLLRICYAHQVYPMKRTHCATGRARKSIRSHPCGPASGLRTPARPAWLRALRGTPGSLSTRSVDKIGTAGPLPVRPAHNLRDKAGG